MQSDCIALVHNSKLELPHEAVEKAGAANFQLEGYKFPVAGDEESRSHRIVRVAVVQNEIVKPTTAPLSEQVRWIVLCQ